MKLIKTEDGLDTFHSLKYNQTYHSKHGVLQESQYVFLDGAGVSEKIKQQKKLSVLEIGFGSGFNFFLTATLARKKRAKLFYFSVENDLLAYDDFLKLNHNSLFAQNGLRVHFMEWRKQNPELDKDKYEIDFEDIHLVLININAIHMKLSQNQFDAVYQDAFSPDANPELWTVSFFRKIKSSMKQGAKLSTYSAKGSVKRALSDAGFVVLKQPGPKGKREMLVAVKD
jgi:tRNA U34 5-methylaminomethyl-2-thiouridine-forming methyltransferase MnmC